MADIEEVGSFAFHENGDSANTNSGGAVSYSRNLPQIHVYEAGVPSSRPELGTCSASTLQNLEWQRTLRENLQLCRASIFRQQHCSYFIQKTTLPETNYLFLLESSLFDMATSGLSEGCFYAVVFRQGRQKYVRFLESGIFQGFFESKGLNLICSSVEVFEEEDLLWEKVFTEGDLQISAEDYTSSLADKRSKLGPSTNQKLPLSGRRYNKVLKTNKQGIINSLDHFLLHVQTRIYEENDIECLGVLVRVEKKKSFKDKDCVNYFSASKCLNGEEFDLAFNSYRTEGNVNQAGTLNFLSPLHSPVSWNQQLRFISSISNLHKWQRQKIAFSQWLSIMDVKGKYKPASPRNQILFYFREGFLSKVYDVCTKLRNSENPTQHSASACSTSSSVSTVIGSDDVDSPAPKRRRTEPRKRLTMTDLLSNISSLDPQFSSQNMSQKTSPYETFKFAMIENGHLNWRRSSSNIDIFVLNDVSMATGLFQEDCYVHLTRLTHDGITELTCSCSMYATLLQVVSFGVSEEELDDVDLGNISCCHMRLFNEFIVDHLTSILNNTSRSENNLIRKLELTKDQINDPVCHLPTPSNRTSKFSVFSEHDYRCSFVHIIDKRLCCQSGYCDALFSCSKRNVVHLDDAPLLCPHLIGMKNHQDVWLSLLPEVDSVEPGTSNEAEDDCEEELPPPPLQLQDAMNDTKGHKFNEVSGLWEYPSLSLHKPSDDGSESLQNSMQLRETFNDRTFGRDEVGFLNTAAEGYHKLFPEETPDNCKCGAGYNVENGVRLSVAYMTTVYMNHGPAKYKIWITQCGAKTRQCDVGPGQNENIHFLTRETGAGDEIGWDFVDHVINSYITFGAYCSLMNNRYRRINSKSASFMSNNTFIAWWFSWISKFDIDFRQPCKLCKFTPKFLAADGTKIGINVSHSTVTPIETPSVDTLIDPCHRRNNRAFISYSQGDLDAKEKAQTRDHLLYHSKKALGTLKATDVLPLEEEMARNGMFFRHVGERFLPLVLAFIHKQCGNRMHKKLAVLFKILSTNHSLSSILPLRYVDEFQSILRSLRQNRDVHSNTLNKVAQFSPEIRDILISGKGTAISSDMIDFFEHLCERVLAIFVNCKEPDVVNPKPGSYNPAKFGRAYYFTAHGEQIRDIPKYTMGSSSSSNYDDEPARESEKCSKKFPEVGRKGTTYLFLWFDPQHYGHCYGYHMIPGHEGRKDPACSAYAFLETAPEEMFYDFSCQLEEYCLNREPGYWKNTRFFHDTFHGFSHSCAAVYKSSRLMLLRKVNTEICEQTNAFLQHIRYSARAMSMSKFNHFLQFFLYQWSKKKYENFTRKCALATTYVT